MKPHLPVALLVKLMAALTLVVGFGVYENEYPNESLSDGGLSGGVSQTGYTFSRPQTPPLPSTFATGNSYAERTCSSGFRAVAGDPGDKLVYTTMPGDSTALFATGGDLRGLEASSRYSDTGKGCYFSQSYNYYQPYRGAEELYQQNGNWGFMGANLAPSINHGSSSVSGALGGLTHDVSMCWANATANVLQYWQSYYGIFYDGCKGELPYGWNYDPSLAPTLGGSQSLAIYNEFYKHWYDEGGTFKWASDWYCRNVDPSKLYIKNEGTGGWWENWFGESKAYVITYFNGSSNIKTLTNTFAASLGYSQQEDGSWAQTTMGQIGYLGISSYLGGHALTCWGMDFDEQGLVHSIYIANSDDLQYGTVQLFLKSVDGQYYLFSDADCTEYWNWNAANWYLDEVSYLNTPQALKDLYRAYSTSDLVWTGAADEWSVRLSADQQIGYALPDATSGWTADVNGTAYHSYYEAGRNLVFGDAAVTQVSTAGALKAGRVELSNVAKDYVFTATEAQTSLEAANLHASTSGGASFIGMELSFSDSLLLDGYALSVRNGSLSAGTATLQGGASLSLENSTACFTDLLLGDGTVLTLDFSRAGDDEALVSVSGTLSIQGALTLNVGGLPTDLSEIYMVFSAGEFDEASWGDNITVNGTTKDMLFWSFGVLYYGSAVDKGHQFFTEHTEAPERWRKFVGLSFTDIAYDKDGAALTNIGTLSFERNGPVDFTGNSTQGNGGAVANAGTLLMEGNRSVTFRANRAEGAGGALSQAAGTLSISGSREVNFVSDQAAAGGAIAQSGGSMSISGNDRVSFADNRATEAGGAIRLTGGTLSLADNGTLSFTHNRTEGRGGAIDNVGAQLVIRGNGDTQFTGNHAGTTGGALANSGDGRITLFADAGDITFRGNTQGSGAATILRAIDSQGDVHDDASKHHFSASEGHRITFYDSVRVENTNYGWYASQTNLNTQGSGTIEFSGKYAEADLLAATGNAPTAEALAASRSSVFTGDLYLAGGTLRIADGASVSAHVLYFADGAAEATIALSNGILSTPSRELIFNVNKTLELTGVNTITTSYLAFEDGATLTFNLGEENKGHALLSVNSGDVLDFYGSLTFNINGGEGTATGRYQLIEAQTVSYASSTLTLNGALEGSLSWQDGILWYDADYRPPVEPTTHLVFTETQSGSFTYEGNDSLTFTTGGTRAIDERGAEAAEVSLAHNGPVAFRGISTEGEGGAIANVSHDSSAPSVITVEYNMLVELSGIKATGDGGAISNRSLNGGEADIIICGNSRHDGALDGDSNVMLNANSSGGSGGALFNSGTVVMADNGEIYISNNVALGNGGGICNEGLLTVTENYGLNLNRNKTDSEKGRGGAVANRGEMHLDGNFYIVATGNSSLYGAAVYNEGALSMDENGYIQFSGNDSTRDEDDKRTFGIGGNICNTASGEVSVRRNGDVSLTSAYGMYGGSIYNEGSLFIEKNNDINIDNAGVEGNGGGVWNHGTFVMRGNGHVTFNEDWAWGGYGGAVCNMAGTVDISDNASLSVYSSYTAFSNGTSDTTEMAVMNLCGNGGIVFYDNIAYRTKKGFDGKAGALYNLASGTLNICGNGDVTFYNNTILTFAEVSPTGKDFSYLHALHNEGTMNLSAAAGKSITFFDGISSAEGSAVNLNADYSDAEGQVQHATGDIVFSGAMAESLLHSNMLAEFVTPETIRLSQTSDLDTQVMLHNGSLRVEAGAVLNTRALTAKGGACIEVRNATLTAGKLEMEAGSTMKLGTATLHTADGKTSATGSDLRMSDSGLYGQGGKLVNTLIDLKEGATFELSDIVLAASSRITDDPARLVLDKVTAQAAMGVNAERRADSVLENPVFVQSGDTTLTADVGGIVTVTNMVLTSFDTVTLSGNSLTIALSGLGYAESRENNYIAVSFTAGKEFATFDRGLSVTLSLTSTGDTLQGWFRGDELAPTAVYFDMVHAPEPATATLSLATLLALAARRRRKGVRK